MCFENRRTIYRINTAVEAIVLHGGYTMQFIQAFEKSFGYA
ncbi:MAG: hypothetical protein QXT35_07245 [Conexivisphaerales archaeon]